MTPWIVGRRMRDLRRVPAMRINRSELQPSRVLKLRCTTRAARRGGHLLFCVFRRKRVFSPVDELPLLRRGEGKLAGDRLAHLRGGKGDPPAAEHNQAPQA